jgi:hypothetical protein
MTARVIAYVGEPRHVDDLCPTCWCASVWTCDIVTLGTEGVTIVGSWTGCVECP